MTRKFFFFSEMGYNAYPLEALVQEDPLHRIYWEEYGPADGEPVIRIPDFAWFT